MTRRFWCGQGLLKTLMTVGAVVVFTGAGFTASGKELSNRLGVGYSDQFSESLPSLAVRYYPNASLGLSASLGVDTRKDNSRFGFMARVHRVIFTEANLNFYMGAGAGILSVETAGKNESGFELSGFFGAEFFLYGLDSLAFMFESGVGVTSISSEVRFRTLGEHPVRAGMAFYF